MVLLKGNPAHRIYHYTEKFYEDIYRSSSFLDEEYDNFAHKDYHIYTDSLMYNFECIGVRQRNTLPGIFSNTYYLKKNTIPFIAVDTLRCK